MTDRMPRGRWLAPALACALALGAAGTARAQERKGAFELSEFLSYTFFSTETSLDDNAGFGLRAGHTFSEYLGLEFTYHRSDNADITFVDDPSVDMNELQGVLIVNWKRFGKKFGTRFQPYIGLGLGYEDFNPKAGLQEKEAGIITKHQGGTGVLYQDSAAKVDSTGTIIAALGTRFYLTENLALRLDLRQTTAIAADFSDVTPSLGLSFLFGGTGGRDSDRDGIIDWKDDCPDTPEGAWVTPRGCPTDQDGDKVLDGLDQCPDTPPGVVVDAKGCPVDGDGDGVPDGIDQCPDTVKGCTVDAKGCPSDSDGDGACDGLDTCPGSPAGCAVDGSGCPKDEDGDGLCDPLDKCPRTPQGDTIDETGCTVVVIEEGKKEVILKGVNFATNKADLTPESLEILDTVAASLIENPEVTVELGGHTDSTGSRAWNEKLSGLRAESVMKYLEGKGIEASRMTAMGYAATVPIADNKTTEGKAQNRRTEIKRTDSN